jgi:putative transposase
MHRTIRIEILPTPEGAKALEKTCAEFTEVFNEVCRVGWEQREKNGVRLHHLTYRRLKEKFPKLVCDLHCQARIKATEALKFVFQQLRKGKKSSCPHSLKYPLHYERHTMRLSWEHHFVRLSTVDGVQHFEPMTSGKICTADLIHRNGLWYLYVSVSLPAPQIKPNKTVVGVDLGVNRPAVVSTPQFLGERRWRNIEAKIFNQVRRLQSKKTKSSKRKQKQVRRRLLQFRRDCNHVLSKKIVKTVRPGGTIVLENLTGIHKRTKGNKRQRRRLHSWSFAQLRSFVEYKAEDRGIRVIAIDPRNTSKTCSKCRHCSRNNRRSQSHFKCQRCGFALNADLNAARNIRRKYLDGLGKSLTARPISTGPTSSNTQCGRAVPLPASRCLQR